MTQPKVSTRQHCFQPPADDSGSSPKRYVRITHDQYRNYSQIAKQHACTLSLVSTVDIRGNWGEYSAMANDVFIDASSDLRQLGETIVLKLAADIPINELRKSRRPEMDWAALDDSEIHDFVFYHELGHRLDNFQFWDIWKVKDLEAHELCRKWAPEINELLADRYAWSVVRPGEPVPLSQRGRERQQEMADRLAFLDSHLPRGTRPRSVFPAGQYEYVPTAMLASADHAAYVGPNCAPEKLAHQAEYDLRTRERLTRPGLRLFDATPSDSVFFVTAERELVRVAP
jgi:hypothetical protein